MPVEKAIRIIKEGSGTQFDPKIVEVFLEIMKGKSKDESEKVLPVPLVAENQKSKIMVISENGNPTV
jgi:HD-GYP domain-containing protein (c-di-GMP phosphodiesterase class II)